MKTLKSSSINLKPCPLDLYLVTHTGSKHCWSLTRDAKVFTGPAAAGTEGKLASLENPRSVS